MLVGHFAVALLAKRSEPKVSLGALAAAAMLPDLLWPIFLIVGLEHVLYRPGRGAAQYLDFAASSFDFSHSLLLDVVWAVLFAGLYLLLRRYRRGAGILFILVLSHWTLDIVSDRSMPLAPGVHTRIGLGLWAAIPFTLLVEGGLWLCAMVSYWQLARLRSRWRSLVFWSWCALLTLIWYNNIAGPPPPNPRAVPIVTLILFSVLIAWVYWIERLSRARLSATASTP